MPRKKQTIKTKVTKPVTKPVVIKKKPTKTREAKLTLSSDFQEQVKAVLAHILEILKAALKDAFIQYINGKLQASQPASAKDFMDSFKHTVALHGISEETLLDSLNEVELELLAKSQSFKDGQILAPSFERLKITKETPVIEPEPTLLNTQHTFKPTADLGVVEKPTVSKKEEKVSVFDSLDLI